MSVEFHSLIKDTCDKTVLQTQKSHPILKILSNGLNIILRKSKYTRYEDRRINDLGKSLEQEIKDIITHDNDIKLIPYSQHLGYPDLRVQIHGKVVFIEIKTTSKEENFDSTQRVFYYTNGNKISDDGYHLLIQLFLEASPSNPNSYIFKKWRIRDLYSLSVSLKREYNASYRDLNNLPVLCGS